MSGMRRIRAHLRILENGAPVTAHQRSKGIEQSRRRQSFSHAPVPPPYAEQPQNRASLEYHPDRRANVGARPDQFVRFDRQETYGRAHSSDASSRSRSRSTSVRFDTPRGRSERRQDSYDSSDSNDFYSEKRRIRGRSMNR